MALRRISLAVHEVLTRMRERGLEDEADWVVAELARFAF